MLVDKVFNEDGTVSCLFKSSNILMSEYDQKNQKIKITFNYGGVYLYEGVNYKDYLRFEADESQGKTFNKYIKVCKTTNLGKTDVSEMKERLNKLLKG